MLAFAPVQYFFPGVKTPPDWFKAAAAERYGCPWPSVPRCESGDSEGPGGGKRGCLVGLGSDRPVLYRPNTMRSDRLRPDGSAYIMAHHAAGPADFARRRKEDFLRPGDLGTPVAMADGSLWIIPVANPSLASCTVPCVEVLRDGEWTLVPRPQYEELCNAALHVASDYRAAFFGDRPFSLNDEDIRQLVGQILAVNYDISVQEASVLRLFDRAAWRRIIEAFIDWPGMLAILEAEAGTVAGADPTEASPAAPGISDLLPGAPASALTLSPPAPTTPSLPNTPGD